MVGHACPGPLGGEGTGFRSIRYEQSGDFSEASAEQGARVSALMYLLECRVSVFRDDDVLQHGYS